MPAADAVLPEHLTGAAKDAVMPADLKPLGPLGGPNAEMRKPMPGWVEGLENYALTPAMMTGGAALGTLAAPGLGTAAGAGVGALGADFVSAKLNQKLYGHSFQPTLGGMAASAGLGAATEAIPGAGSALMRGMAARGLRKAGETAAEGAEKELFQKILPATAEQYGEKVGEADAAQQTAQKAAQEKAQAAAVKEVAPQAAQQEMQQFVGRTPEAAANVQVAEPLEHAQRRARIADAVGGPMAVRGQELGQRFEQEISPEQRAQVLKNPENLAAQIEDERKYATERGFAFSSKVQQLMRQIDASGGDSDWAAIAKVHGAKEADRLVRGGDPNALAGWARASRDIIEQAKKTGNPLPGEDKPLTVADALGIRSQALNLMRTEDGPSRAAASSIRESIDDALTNQGIKFSPELRAEYADYKKLFDKPFRRAVFSESEPVNYAKQVFSDQPQRAMQLIKRADPQQRASLRGLFGDYALGLGPQRLAKEVNPDVMRALYGDSPYARVKPWLETEPKAQSWQNLMNSSPDIQKAAQQSYKESFGASMKEITEQRARGVRNAALDVADQLGPAGSGIKMRLKAAKTPEEAAQIAQQTFGPIFDAVPQPMPDAANRAGMQAYRESKAIQTGLDLRKTREQAAIAHIQKLAQKGDPFASNLKRKLMFYGPVGAALLATGHVSPYLMGAAGFSVIGPMLLSPRGAMLKALTDDAAATEFYRGVSLTPNGLNAKSFGSRMGRMAARLAAQEMTGAAIRKMGLSADVPPEKGDGE